MRQVELDFSCVAESRTHHIELVHAHHDASPPQSPEFSADSLSRVLRVTCFRGIEDDHMVRSF